MNSNDEYSYRATSLPSNEYENDRTSSPGDEYAYRETSLPTEDSMFLPLLGDSPEDESGRADMSPRAPTLSPVLLSPSSTTQKLIASGKIKNCIILLQKANLDHSSLRHPTDEATETATLPPPETEPSKDLPAESEEGPAVTGSPNCEQDHKLDTDAVAVPEDQCPVNRNIFASLSELCDVKTKGGMNVRGGSPTETAYYMEDANRLRNSSKEICRSISSSIPSSPIADCRSENGDDKVDRTRDGPSCRSTDFQSDIDAKSVCQIVDCQSKSMDNIVDRITDCRSVKSDIGINYILNRDTIDQNTDCGSVHSDALAFDVATENVTNCRSNYTDTVQDRTVISVSTADQTTDCHSHTYTDVTTEIAVPDLDKQRSSWSDDLMSISSTGSSETFKYPLSSEDKSPGRCGFSDDDWSSVELEVPGGPGISEDAEMAGGLCDEPPRLERLESLPALGVCLDIPPVLSPPMLTPINDDLYAKLGNGSAGVDLRESQRGRVSPKDFPFGRARRELLLDIDAEDPPVCSSVGTTGVTDNMSQLNKTSSSDPVDGSTISSERLKEEFRDVTSQAHELFPSLFTETASGGQGGFEGSCSMSVASTPFQEDQSEEETPLSQEDQCREAEHQDTHLQAVDRSGASVDKQGIDICREGSARNLEIVQVVSLGECTQTIGHESLKIQEEYQDLTPDTCASVVGHGTDEQGSPVHQRSTWTGDDALVSESETSKDMATSRHSSLSDVNSATEIERAVASILETQQSNDRRVQVLTENPFDDAIQVAEVVIDLQDGNSSPSTDGGGMMPCLDETMQEEDDSESRDPDGVPGDMPENEQVESFSTSGDVDQTPNGIPRCQASQSSPVAGTAPENSVSLKLVEEQILEEPIALPSCEDTMTGEGNKSQPVDPSGHTERPSSNGRAEHVLDMSETLVPKQTTRLSEIIVVHGNPHVSPVPQAPVSSSDGSGPADQELQSRRNILSKTQSVHQDDSGDRINSIDANRTNQSQSLSVLDRNQSRSTEVISTARLTNKPPFLPSSSLEMDTAISLAFMSEMAPSTGSKNPRATDEDKAPSYLSPCVVHDKAVDARTRHLSAPRVSGGTHREEPSDDATPQRPKSAHGASGHNFERFPDFTPGSQTTALRNARGRYCAENGSRFMIVESSGPLPLAADNGQFDELKRRLMQEREERQPESAPQPTPSQTPSNSARAVYKPKNRPFEGWNGVPVEFPDGKRFIAYNKESLQTLPRSRVNNAEFSEVSTSRPTPSQFGSAVQTSSSHVTRTLHPNIQQQRSDVSNPYPRQRPMGSNNTHSSASFPGYQQVDGTFRSPHSSPSVEARRRNDNPQLLPAVHSHNVLSSKAKKMSTDQAQYLPDRTIPSNRMGQDLGGYPKPNAASAGFQVAWEGRTAHPRQSVPTPVQGVAEAPIALTTGRSDRCTTGAKSAAGEQPTVPTRSTPPWHRPGSGAQVRLDGQEKPGTHQHVPGVSLQASDYNQELVEAQQRLFGRARGAMGSAKPPRGGIPSFESCESNPTPFQQSEGGVRESISAEQLRPNVSGCPTKTAQSLGHGGNVSLLHHPSRDGSAAARVARVAAPLPEPVIPGNLPGRPLSASSYMSGLAQISERNAMNQNAPGSRNVPLHPLRDQVPAEGREQGARIQMANVTNSASREPQGRAVNLDTNQRHVNLVAQAESDDLAFLTTIPNLCGKEITFLESLPSDLATYLVKQRKQGIPIVQALKTLLAEDDETAARGERRVWRSTIHYRSSDASPQCVGDSSRASEASTHSTPLAYRNQEANSTTTARPFVSRDTLQLPSQNADSSSNPQSQQQLRPTSQGGLNMFAGVTRTFYNPPPSVTPLLEADDVASLKAGSDVEEQMDTTDCPESNGSALDLRTRTAGSDAVLDEDYRSVSQFSPFNGDLYHRAYTAGAPGPIRASSLVNLSSAATMESPIMEKSLSHTQLLIRRKLLERRLRIQGMSISTPDILQGYSYPPRRESESSMLPKEVSPPRNPAPSSYQSRGVGLAPSVVSSQLVGSAQSVSPREIPEVAVQDMTAAGHRQPVSQFTTSAQYPKIKANLQNRWVTETVQPLPLPGSNHQEKAPAVDQSNQQVRTAQEVTHTPVLSSSAPATVVHQPSGNFTVWRSSDHAAARPSTSPVEVVSSVPAQGTDANLKSTGRNGASRPPRKRKAVEATPHRPTCPFCSFQGTNSWVMRAHVNREHFDKYSKSDKPRRGRAKATPKVSHNKSAMRISPNSPASQVPANLDGELVTSPVQSVAGTGDSIKRTSGSNHVPSHTESGSGQTFTADTQKLAASPSLLQQVSTTANAPRSGPARQSDGSGSTEATPLASHPVANGRHTDQTKSTQESDAPLHCRHCMLHFKSAEDLLIHIKFQHTNTKGLCICFNCGYSTKSNSTLMRHILKWHGRGKGDGKTFKCTQYKCKEVFSSEEELKRHYVSHEAQRTYACDLCNAKYKHITGLRYHQSRHSLNYPHKCQQCGLKFKSTGMLQRHEFQKKHFSP